jgi:hypothetical protein
MRFAALALVALLCSHASAEAAPKARPWEKLENVTFKT